MRSRLVSAGAALPKSVVASRDIERRLGLAEGWIEARTGILERRVLAPGESMVDLAERAAREALAAADLSAGDVDAVIVATTSGPYLFPSLACMLHERLGLARQPAFDVAAACAGFPYALSVADQAIRAGDHRTLLVLGADCLSTCCDPSDSATAPLFGDGAGAVVLAAEPEVETGEGSGAPRGVLACRLRALGALWPSLKLPSGVRRSSELDVDGVDPWMRMVGADVFRAAVEHLVELSREVLAAAHLATDDVTLVVPHQANLRIIRMMLTQLGIPASRALINLDRRGNTSAASIPIALAEGVAAGRIHAGDVLLLGAVGGGFTAGAAVVRW